MSRKKLLDSFALLAYLNEKHDFEESMNDWRIHL